MIHFLRCIYWKVRGAVYPVASCAMCGRDVPVKRLYADYRDYATFCGKCCADQWAKN